MLFMRRGISLYFDLAKSQCHPFLLPNSARLAHKNSKNGTPISEGAVFPNR
jgi:hypothetical protein